MAEDLCVAQQERKKNRNPSFKSALLYSELACRQLSWVPRRCTMLDQGETGLGSMLVLWWWELLVAKGIPTFPSAQKCDWDRTMVLWWDSWASSPCASQGHHSTILFLAQIRGNYCTKTCGGWVIAFRARPLPSRMSSSQPASLDNIWCPCTFYHHYSAEPLNVQESPSKEPGLTREWVVKMLWCLQNQSCQAYTFDTEKMTRVLAWPCKLA